MRQIDYFDGTGAQALNTAGTPYTIPIPSKPGLLACMDSFIYTAGATAHTAYLMRALGRTTISLAAALSQAVINLAADPGAGLATGANLISANDWLIIQSAATKLYYAVQVSSVSTLAITLTANVPVAFAVGDKVFFYGIKTDVSPETGLVHANYAMTASTAVTISNLTGNGLVAAYRMNEPILFFVDNITAQGTVNRLTWLGVYQEGSPISGLMGDSHQPHEVLGNVLSGLPWTQILSGLGGMFAGIFGKILATPLTPSAPAVPGVPGAPTVPAKGPLGGTLGPAILTWLQSLFGGAAAAPAPTAPAFPPTFPPTTTGS
jgi:hypothetical protein